MLSCPVLWNVVLDFCREADGEVFYSSTGVCGSVLLRLNEWRSFCLVKVNLLDFDRLKGFHLVVTVEMW